MYTLTVDGGRPLKKRVTYAPISLYMYTTRSAVFIYVDETVVLRGRLFNAALCAL